MYAPVGLDCLYLDFDSFFASAEQHFRPELRGRPVGVLPLDSPNTSCIAASREAKRFGIKVGTPVHKARRLCPSIALVAARPDVYVRLHHAIVALVEQEVPVTAVRSIDEMACTLLANEQARAEEIARAIKHRLAVGIGPTLTCSIGLGPNELIAKIGAEMDKPDGLVRLPPESLPGALLGLGLTDIPGIGAGNVARLARAGIHDVAGLWATAPKQMRALWGNVEGERFWDALHGGRIERPPTLRRMFGHSRVLARDWRTPERLRDCARLLLVKAARRMRREYYAACALSLSLRLTDNTRLGAEEFFPPLRSDHDVLDKLDRLLARAGAQISSPPRGVYVALHRLVPAQDGPHDLLETPEAYVRRQRWERLADITDALNQRHGAAAAPHLGPRAELPGGYAGAKIAFGRIPDLADF